MTISATEQLDFYLDEFIATQSESIRSDFKTVLGLVCCFEDAQFLEEIAKPDPSLYKLYLDAEAFIQCKIDSV